jgi:hypothetical protein
MEHSTVYTLEDAQAQAMTPQFIVNDGGKWDETNSRIHCCEVFYRDPCYIQQSIKKWAGSIREAYLLAVAAFEAEKVAGRAL